MTPLSASDTMYYVYLAGGPQGRLHFVLLGILVKVIITIIIIMNDSV